MPKDFEAEQHTYRPGLRLRGLRFLSDDEIELDFEGLDTGDRVYHARREWLADRGFWLYNFDDEFARLYRGVPILSAGMSLNPLILAAWSARLDELPSDEEWQREFDERRAELGRRWIESGRADTQPSES